MKGIATMKRRTFLIRTGEGAIVAPLALFAVSCSSDSNNDPTGSGPSGFNVGSSNTAGHTHSVTVLFRDLDGPPAGGVTYTSTTSGTHNHRITLTQEELTTVANGGSVTVTSTNDGGHTHDWTIRRP